MPYPITAFDTGVGFARLALGANDEFTVLSASCVLHALSHNPAYGYPTIEFRDASDGLIYRQTMNTVLNDFIGVAAAAEGEPWYLSNNGQFGFPQATEQQSNAAMSLRLPPITLTPGCTFGFYIATAVLNENQDPMGSLSPNHDVLFPHLWVEDTNPLGRDLPGVGNPILLGIGG